MLSTIKIDVDQDNQPIIVINYQSSGDIRDKLVKRFLETFAGSSLTKFSVDDHTPGGSISSIRPIPLKEYPGSLIIPIEFAEVQYQIQSDENKKNTGSTGFGEYATCLFDAIAGVIRRPPNELLH